MCYNIKGDESFDRVNSMKYIQGTPDLLHLEYGNTIWSQII